MKRNIFTDAERNLTAVWIAVLVSLVQKRSLRASISIRDLRHGIRHLIKLGKADVSVLIMDDTAQLYWFNQALDDAHDLGLFVYGHGDEARVSVQKADTVVEWVGYFKGREFCDTVAKQALVLRSFLNQATAQLTEKSSST